MIAEGVKNLYQSPDLFGDFILKPSKWVHSTLWNSPSIATKIIDIALQAIYSPVTATALLINLKTAVGLRPTVVLN